MSRNSSFSGWTRSSPGPRYINRLIHPHRQKQQSIKMAAPKHSVPAAHSAKNILIITMLHVLIFKARNSCETIFLLLRLTCADCIVSFVLTVVNLVAVNPLSSNTVSKMTQPVFPSHSLKSIISSPSLSLESWRLRSKQAPLLHVQYTEDFSWFQLSVSR